MCLIKYSVFQKNSQIMVINKDGEWWKGENEDGQVCVEMKLVYISSCINTVSIRDDSYWTSRRNSLELIESSSINKVSLVYISSCRNTVSVRDDPYWTSRRNNLELIELSSINKVSLV